jgi:predicted nucleic acid-binding protein
MSQYLIDTDWVIQVLHGDQTATTTIEDLAEHGLAISMITYGELYEGSYYASDSQRAIAALEDFLSEKDIIPL